MMRMLRFAALAAGLAACAAPEPPPRVGAAAPKPAGAAPAADIAACYDADRDLVSHVVPHGCAGEVIDPTREAQLAAERRLRIYAALNGGKADPLTGNLRLAGTGSSFFVSPAGDLLTNHHVVADCEQLTATQDGGPKTAARVLASDAARDLALLRTSEAPRDYARFNAAPLEADGDALGVAGYPAYGLPTIHPSLIAVSAPTGVAGTAGPQVVFEGAIRRGHSGSPLLDGAGGVLGVVRAKPDIPAIYHKTGKIIGDLGIAVSYRSTVEFLQANGVRPTLAAKEPPLARDALAEKARRFVAQVGCWRSPTK
jgi:serine protease Do